MTKKSKTIYSLASFRFLVITTLAALFILGAKNIILNLYGQNSVLGASTFIADNSPREPLPQQQPGGDQPDLPNPSGAPQGQLPPDQANLQNLNKLEFQTENGQTHVNVQQGDLNFELSSNGGQLEVHARSTQGEFHLEQNALGKINEVLSQNDIEIGSSSADELTLRKGNVEAQTHFPLSINPATNTLTVTTPAGVKEVAVLPDQAVENLLSRQVISTVSATTTATNGAQLQLVTLGLLNNQPAFQVMGVSYKKLFGFIPVGIDKTAYVSAQSGQVLQTNESLLSQLFDLLSTQ